MLMEALISGRCANLVFWLTASVLTNQGAALRPIINGQSQEGGSVEVEASSSYTFRCIWTRPIAWILPNNSLFRGYSNPLLSNNPRASITSATSGDSTFPYESILKIHDLQTSDTGLYICQDDTAQEPNYKNSVYVFVPGRTDSETLMHFANAMNLFSIDVTRRDHLECKATLPDVQVHLFVEGNRIQSIDYEQQEGIYITPNSIAKPSSTKPILAAECRATYDDGKSYIDTQRFVIKPRISSTIEVNIEQSDNARHPYINGNMSLLCVVKPFYIGINCSWDYPALKTWDAQSSKSRVTIHNGKIQPDSIEYAFDVSGLSRADQGLYKCMCQFQGGPLRSASFTLANVSETRGQIKVKSVVEQMISYPAGSLVQMQSEVSVWPVHNWEHTWTHRYTDPLTGDEKVTLRSGALGGRLSLPDPSSGSKENFDLIASINDLRPSDAGIYNLTVAAGGDMLKVAGLFYLTVTTENPTLDIWISDKRNLSKKVDPRFLQLDEEYNFVVHTVGQPFPNVTIEHASFECGTNNSCHEWHLHPESQMTQFQGHSSRIKLLEFKTKESLYFRALQKGQEQKLRAIATNVPAAEKNQGLNIVPIYQAGHVNRYIYEHEAITIDCYTQKYDFDDEIVWYKMKDGFRVKIGSSNQKATVPVPEIYSNTTSPFSNRLSLIFHRINYLDSAQYICEGQLSSPDHRSKQTVSKSIDLMVSRLVAPHWFNASAHWPSLGVSKLQVNYTDTLNLICAASGSPNPSVSWYKDGQALSSKQSVSPNTTYSTYTIPKVVEDDAGVYKCIAQSMAGSRQRNFTLRVQNGPSSKQLLSKTGIVALCLGLIVALIVVIFLIVLLVQQRRKEKRNIQELKHIYTTFLHDFEQNIDPNRPVNHQADHIPYDRRFELSKEQIQMGDTLGEGQFGRVVRALLSAPATAPTTPMGSRLAPLPVAVKVPLNGRNPNHQKALLDELKIMIHLGRHINVLGLIGAVTKFMVKGELYVVVELCELGCLKDYLKGHRAAFLDEIVHESDLPLDRPPSVTGDGYLTPNRLTQISSNSARRTSYQSETDCLWAEGVSASRNHGSLLTTSDILSFAYQTANGMDFLASKTLIHRDLAARNLLVTNEKRIKIADFGLARQNAVYHIEQSRNVPLPIKWMALESILDQDFTVKSDVWSFGVVLWEMFALGETPYPTVALDNNFVSYLRNGNRLDRTKYVPVEIYDLMRQCWMVDCDIRPSFAQCRHDIGLQLKRCSPQLFDSVSSYATQDTDQEQALADYVNWRPITHSISSKGSSFRDSSFVLQPLNQAGPHKPNALLLNTDMADDNIQNPSYGFAKSASDKDIVHNQDYRV